MNPYRGLPDTSFWSRAVSRVQHGQIDPVGNSRVILPSERVATIGSCFAQHLSRQIQASGLDYFVTERSPPGMSPQQSTANNYGTFSARYGNVYTVRQALQLFDMAFGNFSPVETVWEAEAGYVDAFRPRIDQHPKSSRDEVIDSRGEHLGFVRQVFEESDWMVFTLGLTEAWRSKLDGSVFPLAPGVAGGSFDPSRHEFVNFTAFEVFSDLDLLYKKMRAVNPRIRMLLTVSPVNLVATYEKRHVLQSTVCSKAALRVAADEMERKYDNVIYFPSYEIITSPSSEGRYYQDDFRDVTKIGISHVMRVFKRHFIDGVEAAGTPHIKPPMVLSPSAMSQVVCDEIAIENTLKESGFR